MAAVRTTKKNKESQQDLVFSAEKLKEESGSNYLPQNKRLKK